jgi:hypothetical protein
MSGLWSGSPGLWSGNPGLWGGYTGLSGGGGLWGGRFSPATLFAMGEQGYWLDPSDFSTMFQDSAGTTPVTAVGQNVGLILDKSRGAPAALGPELVTNGDFSAGATGWTLGTDWTISGGFASRGPNATATNLIGGSGVEVGKTYQVRWTQSAETVAIYLGNSAGILISNTASAGTYTRIVTATQAGGIVFRANLAITSIDNISVREVPGNHFIQSSLASRPVLGRNPITGTRNLLTRTEEFNDAAWVKNATGTLLRNETDPTGAANGATTLIADNAGGVGQVFVQQLSPVTSGQVYTFSCFIKAGTQSFAAFNIFVGFVNSTVIFNLISGSAILLSGSGTVGMVSVGNGWWRCFVTATANSTTTGSIARIAVASNATDVNYNTPRNGTSGILIWGAQLELGSTATAYQRVTTAFDVTEAGVPDAYYLSYDGSDDFLVSAATINPGAVDKAQVIAGVRKLSDVARAYLIESSPSGGNGNFAIQAPTGAGINNYSFDSQGTTFRSASASGFSAPITNVLTGLGDISAPSAILRVNGTQAAINAASQGTGNYLTYLHYIGRRAGVTSPFNGRIYQIITRFGPNLTSDVITQSEAFVAQRTGFTAPDIQGVPTIS